MDYAPPRPEKKARGLQLALALGLALVVLTTFLRVIGHDFVNFDDTFNFGSNPHVNGLSWENVQWAFTDTTYIPRYMPIGWLCYATNRQFFGLNPHGWHAASLVWHVADTLLLFLLLQLLLRASQGPENEQTEKGARAWSIGVPVCAALGALFWAINPLRVEAVAWATTQIYPLAMLFTLVWLIAWIRSRTAVGTKAQSVWGWVSLMAFAASLLTYPLGIFAPVLLLALDVFPLRRAPVRRTDWVRRPGWLLLREKIPFLLLSAAALGMTVFARMGSAPQFRPVTLDSFGILERSAQAAYVSAYYAWKPWAPFSLSPSYPTLHGFDPMDWRFLLSFAAVAAFALLAFVLYRRHPVVLAVFTCHILILIPVLGLSEYPHAAYDRYSYLPSLLWSALLAGVLWLCWERGRWAASGTVVLAIVCAVFAGLSWRQTALWKNSVSFFEHTIASFGEHPSRSRFDELLGLECLSAGRTNEAIVHFQQAAHYDLLRTDRKLSNENVARRCERRLGDIADIKGDFSAAAAHYKAALSLESEPVTALSTVVRLKAALRRVNREAEALPWFDKVKDLAAGDATLLEQVRKMQEASSVSVPRRD